MARPEREAVETFISLTGASEEAALRKLEEHYGDLNEAINEHFSERDRNLCTNLKDKPNKTHIEDVELDHTVSISLKTEKQHKPLHHIGHKAGGSLMASNGSRLKVGSSSFQDEVEDAKEQPLVRHISTHEPHTASSHSANLIKKAKVSASSSAERHTVSDLINFHEWGGISSPEHVEALMLEAALFGGIAEGSSFHFMQKGLDRNQDYPQRTYCPLSPGLASQRLIRQQQDDEFHASLRADREKELKAIENAEAHRLEEQTVKEGSIDAARREEEAARREEEELCIRLEEEQEIERHLAAKESSLPKEPMVDDENAVTLLVRMPDGSRHCRRFLKSDNLQSLFDFIDVGRVVKPGSFRLVRPYPRRAFSHGESGLSLNELGLTGKQEALFLELI